MQNKNLRFGNIKYILLIIVISLLLHISAFFLLGEKKPLLGDGFQYHNIAVSIIKNFSIPSFGPPVNIRTPGYSLFLVPFYLIYTSEIVPRILNIAISLLSIYLTYIISLKYVGSKRAVIVALIVGLHPSVLFFATMVISDPFAMILVLLLQIYLINRFKKSSKLTFVITGLIIGYLALVKPNLLLFLPVLGIYILFKFGFRKSVVPLVLLVLFASLIIAPWIVRNYVKFDGLIALSSNGGYLFWCSNNEDLIRIGSEGKYYEYRITERWKEIEDLSIVEREKECYKRGLQFYKEDFGRGFLFIIKKIYRFINPLQTDKEQIIFSLIIPTVLLKIVNSIFVVLLFTLFILGVAFLIKNDNFYILIMPIIVIFQSSIIWWSSYRFRLVAEPSIIIISFAGLFGFIDRIKIRKSPFQNK
ncbi:MAG: ArnT family glycosyltransferase [bacterium]